MSNLFFSKRPKQHEDVDMDEIKEKLRNTQFEKSDYWALTIAALITIVPVILLIISFFVGVIWLIFLR